MSKYYFNSDEKCDNNITYENDKECRSQRELISIFEPSILKLTCQNCKKQFCHAAIVSGKYNGVFCSRDCLFAKYGWKRTSNKENKDGREEK